MDILSPPGKSQQLRAHLDEGQQYGTDREIAVISLLQQQPLIIWTGDAEQTPGGIARTAPNAKRSRQLLLAKKHGLRSARQYFTPATREALLSEAGFEKLFRTQNWVRRSKLFCR